MRLECRNTKSLGALIPPTAIYPWWQSAYVAADTSTPVSTPIPLRRYNPDSTYNDALPAPFVNTQPWPIKMDGLVFGWYNGVTNAVTGYASTAFDFRIESSRYGAIISKPLAIGCLSTVDNSRFVSSHWRRVITLPSPYRVGKDENLEVNLYSGGLGALSSDVQVAIRGRDPYNCQAVIRTGTALSPSTQTFVPFSCTDQRDRNVRGIDVHDIVIADKGYTAGGALDLFWMHVRLDPPNGPRWSDDIATSVSMLSGQGHNFNSTDPFSRHDMRFAAPLPLLPGDRVTVTPRVLQHSGAMLSSGSALFVLAYGRQEVPLDRAR